MNNNSLNKKGKLVILSGTSGSGKNFIANQLVQEKGFTKIRIFVTRPLRPNEMKQADNGEISDVVAVYGKYNDGEKSLDEQKKSEKKRIKAFLKLNLPIIYTMYGGYYGFSIEEINGHVDNGKDVVLISSDMCVIRDLKSIYGDNCIPCYIHRNNVESEDRYIEIAKSRNDTIESAKLRYQTARDNFERYTQNIELFDYTILNTGNEIKISQLLNKINNIKHNRAKPKERWSGKIYTLIGSPGSGKDSLLEIVRTQGLLHSLVIPKYTTRKRRDEDGDELICIDDENYNMDSCDIRYENYGNIYGIRVKDLEDRLNDGLSSSIIVSNPGALKKLEEKFPENLVKIYIHGLSKKEYLEKHKNELDDEYISNRIEKYDLADDLYRNHWLDFDHVIIDNGNLAALKNQMYNIMKYYETNRKIDESSYGDYINRVKKYIKTIE